MFYLRHALDRPDQGQAMLTVFGPRTRPVQFRDSGRSTSRVYLGPEDSPPQIAATAMLTVGMTSASLKLRPEDL